MADIFLSYAREDKKLAEVLVTTLRDMGLEIWWDEMLKTGRDFDDQIEKIIHECKCLIVLWTSTSILSRNVKDEANEALVENKLLPIQIGSARPPMGFRLVQTLNWDESLEITDEKISKLMSEVQTFIPDWLRIKYSSLHSPNEKYYFRIERILIKFFEEQIKSNAKDYEYERDPRILLRPNLSKSAENVVRKFSSMPDAEELIAALHFFAGEEFLAFGSMKIYYHYRNKSFSHAYFDFPTIVFGTEARGDDLWQKILINKKMYYMPTLIHTSHIVKLFNEIKNYVIEKK